MAALDELLTYIFDGIQPTLYVEFADWVHDSRRFREFAKHYRSKIRAKLRHVQSEESLQDVRAELETAVLLLNDRRFTLEYEKYAAAKQRGPDFTVTFKTHTPFNIEVRRIQHLEVVDEGNEAWEGKLLAVICEKVQQMPPGIVNLLWLVAGQEISPAQLDDVALTLRQQAGRKEDVLFQRRGFANTAVFHKQYPRLSGIVLRQPTRNVLWPNPLARHEAPREIVLALQRLADQ